MTKRGEKMAEKGGIMYDFLQKSVKQLVFNPNLSTNILRKTVKCHAKTGTN
jgi:hypothetical protein